MKDSPVRYRVLLVDDDSQLLAVTAALLEDDFDVTCAGGGSEALAMLKQGEYDIICSDYRMPDMDGIELLTRVRSIVPSIACLLVTALSEHQRSPFPVMLKPYDPQSFIDRVKREATMAAMKRTVRDLSGPL